MPSKKMPRGSTILWLKLGHGQTRPASSGVASGMGQLLPRPVSSVKSVNIQQLHCGYRGHQKMGSKVLTAVSENTELVRAQQVATLPILASLRGIVSLWDVMWKQRSRLGSVIQ